MEEDGRRMTLVGCISVKAFSATLAVAREKEIVYSTSTVPPASGG
jgi:hypothetical protein